MPTPTDETGDAGIGNADMATSNDLKDKHKESEEPREMDLPSSSPLVDVHSVSSDSSALHSLSEEPTPPSNPSPDAPTPPPNPSPDAPIPPPNPSSISPSLPLQPLLTPDLHQSTSTPEMHVQAQQSLDHSHGTVHTNPLPDIIPGLSECQAEHTQEEIHVSSNDNTSSQRDPTNDSNSQSSDALATGKTDELQEHVSVLNDNDETIVPKKPPIDHLALLAQVEEESQRFEFDLTPDLEGDQHIDPESLLARIKAETDKYNSNGSIIIPLESQPSANDVGDDCMDITEATDNACNDVASAEEELSQPIPSGTCDLNPVETLTSSYDEPDKIPSKMLGLTKGNKDVSPCSHLSEMAELGSSEQTASDICDAEESKSPVDNQTHPYDEPDTAPSRKRDLKDEVVTLMVAGTPEQPTPETTTVESNTELIIQATDVESTVVPLQSTEPEIPIHDAASEVGEGRIEVIEGRSVDEVLDCPDSSPECPVSVSKEIIECEITAQESFPDESPSNVLREKTTVTTPTEVASNAREDKIIQGIEMQTSVDQVNGFTSNEAIAASPEIAQLGNVPGDESTEIKDDSLVGPTLITSEVQKKEPNEVPIDDTILNDNQSTVVEEAPASIIQDDEDMHEVATLMQETEEQPHNKDSEASPDVSSPPVAEATQDDHPDLPAETLTLLDDIENLESHIDEEYVQEIEGEALGPSTEVIQSTTANEECSVSQVKLEKSVSNAHDTATRMQTEEAKSSDVAQNPTNTVTNTKDSVTFNPSPELSKNQNESQTDSPSTIKSPKKDNDHDISDFVIVKHEDVYNQIQNEDLREIAKGQSKPKEEVCEQKEVEEEQVKPDESPNVAEEGHEAVANGNHSQDNNVPTEAAAEDVPPTSPTVKIDIPTVTASVQMRKSLDKIETCADGQAASEPAKAEENDQVAELPSSTVQKRAKKGASAIDDDKRRSLMLWVDPDLVRTVRSEQGTSKSPQHSPENIPNDLKRLKKLVRKERWMVETEHETRKGVWKQLCLQNSAGASVAKVYTEVEEGLFGQGKADPSTVTLPGFVDPDHPNACYALRSEGQTCLNRLLCVLADTRPDILYCPLLAPVASMLLHYMSPEEAFDCVSALLSSTRYKFLETSWVGYESFRISFEKLAAKFAASAHKMFARQGNVAEIYQDWVWWILEDLPFSHIIRIMDCYLSEGLKIFYRVGLAILTLYKKHKGTIEAPDGRAASIRDFVKNIPVTPNALLTVGFQFRGLSRSVIGAYQTKHKEQLREDTSPARRGSRRQNDLPSQLTPINSSIITHQQLHTLWSWVPARYSIYQPSLVFTTQEHGFSLTTFYTRCEYCEPTILLIKTTDQEIFGAFLSVSWSTRNDGDHTGIYFGTGETFMFSVTPEMKKYPWVGIGAQGDGGAAGGEGQEEEKKEGGEEKEEVEKGDGGEGGEVAEGKKKKMNEMFMRATQNLVAIGGGDGDGILIEGDLTKGFSSRCLTFNNPALAKERSYGCEVIEVITMEDGRNPTNGLTA